MSHLYSTWKAQELLKKPIDSLKEIQQFLNKNTSAIKTPKKITEDASTELKKSTIDLEKYNQDKLTNLHYGLLKKAAKKHLLNIQQLASQAEICIKEIIITLSIIEAELKNKWGSAFENFIKNHDEADNRSMRKIENLTEETNFLFENINIKNFLLFLMSEDEYYLKKMEEKLQDYTKNNVTGIKETNQEKNAIKLIYHVWDLKSLYRKIKKSKKQKKLKTISQEKSAIKKQSRPFLLSSQFIKNLQSLNLNTKNIENPFINDFEKSIKKTDAYFDLKKTIKELNEKQKRLEDDIRKEKALISSFKKTNKLNILKRKHMEISSLNELAKNMLESLVDFLNGRSSIGYFYYYAAMLKERIDYYLATGNLSKKTTTTGQKLSFFGIKTTSVILVTQLKDVLEKILQTVSTHIEESLEKLETHKKFKESEIKTLSAKDNDLLTEKRLLTTEKELNDINDHFEFLTENKNKLKEITKEIIKIFNDASYSPESNDYDITFKTIHPIEGITVEEINPHTPPINLSNFLITHFPEQKNYIEKLIQEKYENNEEGNNYLISKNAIQ